jgi:probable rRNA maturation factor
MSDPSVSRRRVGGTLDVYSTVPRARIRKDHLLACARHGARRLDAPVGAINFIIVDDREMARLHRGYSGIRGTTDVLTFDLSDAPRARVDGDIYICLDQARRQAKEYGVPLYLELARLAVHGVLHLAGFDDHSEDGRAEMRRLEDRSLSAVRARA